MSTSTNKNSYEDQISSEHEEKLALSLHGYKRDKCITSTLQGQVFTATNNENKSVVIKKTNKNLHYKGISVINGEICYVSENIVKEAYLMKEFMLYNPPNSCIKYYDFFEDASNFYLVMENGGTSLFDFIVECHKLIDSKKLSLEYWRQIVKYIFAQMVQFIHWLHNKVSCCNLDISLENMLISTNVLFDEKEAQIHNCDIKVIDFGLTEAFNTMQNKNYICNKHVGKRAYQCPQINKNKLFHANKADIWSLSVCLWMMIIGAAPYREPNDNDDSFKQIKKGKTGIIALLSHWNRLHYVTD
eukprot:845629_1